MYVYTCLYIYTITSINMRCYGFVCPQLGHLPFISPDCLWTEDVDLTDFFRFPTDKTETL